MDVERSGSPTIATSPTPVEETKRMWNGKLWLTLEVAVLSALIFVVWSLLSIPIIFYHLPIPDLEISSNSSTNGTAASGDSGCSAPLQYATTSGVCLAELTNILTSSNCPPDAEGNVLVVRDEEDTATQLINGLTFGASEECRRKAVPFLCQHLFGLCGGIGLSIQPTSSQCEEIRDTVCQQEWQTIRRLNIDLPDCAMFPPEASFCPALNNSQDTNGTKYPSFPNGTTKAALECSEGFYRENGLSICIPSCYTWSQYSTRLSLFLDVAIFILTLTGFLGAVAVVILSCLSRKRMLTLPSIFIVYLMMDALALGFLVMVGYLDRNWLFCSSRSLIESLKEVTPFCVITGVLSIYVISQSTLWWLFHITILFWKVVFPFHVRLSGKVQHIHITCVIIGILVPLLPIIISMAKFAADVQKENENSTPQLRNSSFLSGGLGFGPTRFPSILCSNTDIDVIFYSQALIADIILASGCTLLLIILWSVHKLYKRDRAEQNAKFKFGTAEKKLLIVFFYYMGLSVTGIMSSTLSARNASRLIESFQRYFLCEQGGHNPSNPCSRSEIEDLDYPVLDIMSNIFLASFPVVSLLYAVNIQELKELWRKKFTRHPSTDNPSI